jgi:carbonic anhydrase
VLSAVNSARIERMTIDPSIPPAAPITSPQEALAELVAGNKRFVSGRPEPHAVVVGCIDSRVPLEAIFDQTFGSICVVRSGGHVVDRAVLGSVGFAVAKLGAPLIMVLGHKRCGALQATVESLRAKERPPGDIGYLVDELTPAVMAVGLDHPDVAERAMRAHVGRTVRRMRGIDVVAAGGADVVGAVYDLDTGLVDLLP